MTVWQMHVAAISDCPTDWNYRRATVVRFAVAAPSIRVAWTRIVDWCEGNRYSITRQPELLDYSPIATVDLVSSTVAETIPPQAAA